MKLSPDGDKLPRRRGAPRNWREQFLACLAETSNVTASAECAEISLTWVYKTKREDSQFAQAWLVALCEGYDNLEMELLGRLRSGEPRDAQLKYDNATALRILLAHRETRTKMRAQQDNVSAEEVRASIEAKLARLREQVQARRALEEAEARSSDNSEPAAHDA